MWFPAEREALEAALASVTNHPTFDRRLVGDGTGTRDSVAVTLPNACINVSSTANKDGPLTADDITITVSPTKHHTAMQNTRTDAWFRSFAFFSFVFFSFVSRVSLCVVSHLCLSVASLLPLCCLSVASLLPLFCDAFWCFGFLWLFSLVSLYWFPFSVWIIYLTTFSRCVAVVRLFVCVLPCVFSPFCRVVDTGVRGGVRVQLEALFCDSVILSAAAQSFVFDVCGPATCTFGHSVPLGRQGRAGAAHAPL